MKRISPIAAVLVAFAAPDTSHSGPADPVLEIVSFELVEGSDEQAFLTAAKGTESILRDRGALIRRYLVRDSEGTWTDVIEWTSMEDALAAAEAVMSHPDFAPFGAMIKGDSVTMRHANIRWRMD